MTIGSSDEGEGANAGDLVTRNVVLDTNVFVARRFRYDDLLLSKLRDLAVEGEASVISSAIIESEVASNIREDVRSAASAARRFRKEADLLADLGLDGFDGVFRRLDVDGVFQRIWATHQAFVEQCKGVVLPYEAGNVKEVFRRYFERRPPFADGKKKAEFPDAFWLSAIEEWCEQKTQQCYVVSGDGGVQAACKESQWLIPLGTVAEFLDLVFANQEQEASEAALAWLEANEDGVRTEVGNDFSGLGFVTELYESEVTSVEVDSVTLSQPHVIDAGTYGAGLELTAEVAYTADVTYEDEETGVWDKEEARWLFRDKASKRVSRSVTIGVLVDLKYTDDYQLDSAEVNTNFGLDVEVSFYGDDEWV